MILAIMREQGRADAENLQARSADMTNDELYTESRKIPSYKGAVASMNMLNRKAGRKDGFVCVSSAGTVCRLLQIYDSDIFTGEPESLPAQWGRVWSNDPSLAKDFVSDANSPYHKGNCCIENNDVFRSKEDNNVHAPSSYPNGWEKVSV
jgi:hypothetical protein